MSRPKPMPIESVMNFITLNPIGEAEELWLKFEWSDGSAKINVNKEYPMRAPFDVLGIFWYEYYVTEWHSYKAGTMPIRRVFHLKLAKHEELLDYFNDELDGI